MTSASGPIIVPLDGSKAAEQAIDDAKIITGYNGAAVVLLHVVDRDDFPAAEDFATARDNFATYAMRLASSAGIENAKAHTAEGKPGATILRYAREHQASMIIIATHGRGGFQATFIGSVADRVARGAECPVLLVPATRECVVRGPVVVALDGSGEGEEALAEGRALARYLSADVVLVSAYRLPPPVGVEFSYYSPSMLDSFKAATEEYLQKVALPGEKAYTVQGPAASAITETAAQVDSGLVVMASSGKGLAERIALGSTTGRVMHSLHRPLLIIPTGD